MAVKGEISFKSDLHGQLEGPNENKTSSVWEFSNEVYLTLDGEGSRFQGARRIAPFEVIKYIDRITPLLYQIACTGTLCPEIKITLFRIEESTGFEVPYFNFLLENALIVSIKSWMPPIYQVETLGVPNLEKLKIQARKITWEYIEDGITYTEEAF